MIRGDKLRQRFEENAIAKYNKFYLHIWGERGYEMLIVPPIYKLQEYDLTIEEDEKFVMQMIVEGKPKEEIEKALEEKKISKERFAIILEKLKDRDKLKRMLEEKGLPVNLDEWKVEIWAGKSKDGRWVVWKYRTEQGRSMLHKFSLILYRELDPRLLIRLSLALNLIFVLLCLLLAAGYQYPLIAYYLFQFFTPRDLFWMLIVSFLALVIVNLKLNERVFYANWLFLEQETITIPIKLQKNVITTRVITLYLYQSDAIPPIQTDVILWNTQELKKVLEQSYLREYLESLKEIQKLSLENRHLKDQIDTYRDTIDTYQEKFDEVKAVYFNLGLQTKKQLAAIDRGEFPIKDILKAITIIAVVGAITYAIAQLTESPIGIALVMFVFGLIAIAILVMALKYATMKTEYHVVKEAI